MRVYPIILCGGSGVRLWPESRPARPKQFIPLTGELSLFQETVRRMQALENGAAPVIVTGETHVPYVERQLAELGVGGAIIVEPEGRDSAPAIAAAAHWIAAHDPDAAAVVVASDHHIPDPQAFADSVQVALKAAAEGAIVTFGVKPTAPATAYGYIQPGEPLAGVEGVFAVSRFVEKPDAATAAAYVAEGYLWNSGNFVFKASSLLSELERFAPEIVARVGEAMGDGGAFVRLGDSFRQAPKISIDYALMEKTDRAAVAPVSFAWSDLGAWDAVWAATDKDDQGNVPGSGLLVESTNTLIRSSGPLVVGLGLKNVAILAQPDAILVCDLEAAQSVKAVVERLNAAGRPETAVRPPVSVKAPISTPAALRQWLAASALPIWWSLGGDHRGGGFHEALNHDGTAVIAPRRARVQTRQIYTYSKAVEMDWAGPGRTAVAHGLEFFLRAYSLPSGLFRTVVNADGSPADDTARLYDQAFSILALAEASKVTPERRAELLERADAVRKVLEADRRHGLGFDEIGGETPYQSNPHMHLLEAAMAASEAGGGAQWDGLADRIVALCLGRFVCQRSGGVLEYFDTDWAPAAGASGRLLEPGHQFEWAWLLERWGSARGDERARKAARHLYTVGKRGVGIEGAINALMDDGSAYDRNARLWPQTEWLKAAIILGEAAAEDAERATYRSGVARASIALGSFLEDVPVTGLWRDKRNQNGDFVQEPVPASSLYHITCAIAETLKITD